MRWTAVYAQRNAELLLARLKPYPDVRIAAGWRHFNETNDDAVRLTVSVPIPVFDQNQGNILSAQESLAKTKAEREANRNTLIVVAGRAYDSLQGSLRELAVLRETAIPKATEAADAISQGYGQGRFTLLEVLDAQASVAQARLREQEALQNFHVARCHHRRARRQSVCAGPGERAMKTSSTVLVAIACRRARRLRLSPAGAGQGRADRTCRRRRSRRSRTTMSSRTSTAPTASASPTSSLRPPASTLAKPQAPR